MFCFSFAWGGSASSNVEYAWQSKTFCDGESNCWGRLHEVPNRDDSTALVATAFHPLQVSTSTICLIFAVLFIIVIMIIVFIITKQISSILYSVSIQYNIFNIIFSSLVIFYSILCSNLFNVSWNFPIIKGVFITEVQWSCSEK